MRHRIEKKPVVNRSFAQKIRKPLLIFACVGAFCFLGYKTWIYFTHIPSMDEFLVMPEEKIDVGIAGLVFAKEFYPDLDIRAYSRKIDELVRKVQARVGNSANPEERIRAINTVLFDQEGYAYEKDPSAVINTRFAFLNHVLDTRRGTCYTLPMLYMAVARRLGYPIHPVEVPGHLFLRYLVSNLKNHNIEVTTQGAFCTDKSYVENFSVPPKAIRIGGYMRSLSMREYMAELILTNAMNYNEMMEFDKAIVYGHKALQMNPLSPHCYSSLDLYYRMQSIVLQGETALHSFEHSKKHHIKSLELGYLPVQETDYWKRTRG